MIEKALDWLRRHNSHILVMFLLVTIAMLIYMSIRADRTKVIIDEIEFIDSTKAYNQIYYEKTIKDLKKENRILYDSLLSKDKRIDYLIQFTAKKEYNTGKVEIKPKEENADSISEAKTYEYMNEKNDTLSYTLRINSYTEPNWYSLNIKTSDKYTIVNKENGEGINHVTINNNNGGNTISDVTVFKKKEKTKFKDRLIIGPSITAGYDPLNKNVGVMVGVSVTFDMRK